MLNICQVPRSEIEGRYTLALDLGTNSLGLVIRDGNRILASYVIVFPDYEEDGKGRTPNQQRRMTRRQRKTLYRKAGRLNKVFQILSHAKVFPELKRESRHEHFAGKGTGLDKKLYDQYAKQEKFGAQMLPYLIRARAARGEDLSAEALGRALYHLAQKRRFRSGKKERRVEEDASSGRKSNRSVKSQSDPVAELKALLVEHGHCMSEGLCAQVAGGKCNPLEKSEKKMNGETLKAPFGGFFLAANRAMVLDEFDKIRRAQQAKQSDFSREISMEEFFKICAIPSKICAMPSCKHPACCEHKAWQEQVARMRRKDNAPATSPEKLQIWDALRHAIFFQHDLKPQEHLIGPCRYLPNEKRAPEACLEFQEKRYLEKLNYLRLRNDKTWVPSVAERKKLIDCLEISEELSFTQIRKLLSLPGGVRFNFEVKQEHMIPGNRTNARIIAAIGESWTKFDADKKSEIITSLRQDYPDTIHQKATELWGFSKEQAERLAGVELEDGYNALSLQALNQILPGLRTGEDYDSVCAKQKNFQPEIKIMEKLPPVVEWDRTLNNPIVIRALSELRKAVNRIIRRCGLPGVIRVELNRELKKSWLDENAISNQNLANRMTRNQLKADLKRQSQTLEGSAGAENLLKLKLAKECGYHCPYCGNSPCFSENALWSHQVHLEHIIPQTLWGEGKAFENMTLACSKCNNEKGGRTPWEAFGPESKAYDKMRWDAIITAVEHFKGKAAGEKLKRFTMNAKQLEEFLADFSDRQNNDSAHASRRAGDYLSLLYGGRWDAQGTLRVQSCSGDVTGVLRRFLGLERIWKELWSGEKRDDHRHHALDAMVIAMAEPGWVSTINNAAKKRRDDGRLGLDHTQIERELHAQWPQFYEEAKAALALNKTEIIFRPEQKIRGKLHDDNPKKPNTKGSIQLWEGDNSPWVKTKNNYVLSVTKPGKSWKGVAKTLLQASQWLSEHRKKGDKKEKPPWMPESPGFVLYIGEMFRLKNGGKFVVRSVSSDSGGRVGYVRCEEARRKAVKKEQKDDPRYVEHERMVVNQLIANGFQKVAPTM